MAKTATGARRALCVGINDYPYKDNDLKGCVNDARAWASLLTDHFDFPAKNVTVLIDKQATKRGTLSALKSLFTRAKAGDVLVFTNSSHGSYVVDKDGDEERYDEVLCPYDIDDNDIVDDELRALIEDLPKGVRLSVVLDNCFSGTATRARMNTPDDRRIRFLSPVLRGLPVLDNPWKAKRKRARSSESRMREVLLSGCTDREYSYDANFDGVYHGALTYYAQQVIRTANYRLTFEQLHGRLKRAIKDYPQHPQLEGSATNKKRSLFS